MSRRAMLLCRLPRSWVGRLWRIYTQVNDELRRPFWPQKCSSAHSTVAQKPFAWRSIDERELYSMWELKTTYWYLEGIEHCIYSRGTRTTFLFTWPSRHSVIACSPGIDFHSYVSSRADLSPEWWFCGGKPSVMRSSLFAKLLETKKSPIWPQSPIQIRNGTILWHTQFIFISLFLQLVISDLHLIIYQVVDGNWGRNWVV